MATRPADSSTSTPSRLSAIGWFVLGLGFIIRAWQEWKSLAPTGAVFGPDGSVGHLGLTDGSKVVESLSDALNRTRAGGAIKAERRTVHTIEERVGYLVKLVKQGALDPKIRADAMAVLTRKCGTGNATRWCTPAKDWRAEVAALWTAVTDPRSPLSARYTRDHAKVDQFSTARRTQQLRAEDCDGLSTYLGALLGAVGYEPEFVVMQAKGAANWSHILLRVARPGTSTTGVRGASPNEWIILDPSMPEKGLGWEPSGLTEYLVSGRPAGMVEKARIIPAL